MNTKDLEKWADSIYQKLPNKLIWYVKDTLYNPTETLPKIGFHRNRDKSDTSFNTLEKKLFTELYRKQYLKLNGVVIGNYVLKSIDSAKQATIKPKRYLTLSRVVFNANHTKSCYYLLQTLPENHWGGGELIYAEKKEGKWVMLYKELYWIT